MKYRILKAFDNIRQKLKYFPQYWDDNLQEWSCYRDAKSLSTPYVHIDVPLSYDELRDAKRFIKKQSKFEELRQTPSEVVWEAESNE